MIVHTRNDRFPLVAGCMPPALFAVATIEVKGDSVIKRLQQHLVFVLLPKNKKIQNKSGRAQCHPTARPWCYKRLMK